MGSEKKRFQLSLHSIGKAGFISKYLFLNKCPYCLINYAKTHSEYNLKATDRGNDTINCRE